LGGTSRYLCLTHTSGGTEFIIDLFRNIISFGKCVRVCGFNFFFSFSFLLFQTFLLYFLDRPLEKHICNFLVSTYSISLCLQLFFPPYFYIKHFPHFCLRISLICVGGCLVCVLIFFSIYYIFFFSLSSSLDLFLKKFNLTFDFYFQGGLHFFLYTIYR